MEEEIITLKLCYKKFLAALIVPYHESYEVKEEDDEVSKIDKFIKGYTCGCFYSLKLKTTKPKMINDIVFLYLDVKKDFNHEKYLKPLIRRNITLNNTWIDFKKEYITHYLMMCNFNHPEAYFRSSELQQEMFYYLILSKDKDSNKITGKVF